MEIYSVDIPNHLRVINVRKRRWLKSRKPIQYIDYYLQKAGLQWVIWGLFEFFKYRKFTYLIHLP